MALPQLLDAAEYQHFQDMSMVTIRDIIKELQTAPNDAVVAKEVEALTPTQRDTLMKSVYVGLANDCKNSTTYFKWHAAVYAVGGAGCIVRVISDKPSHE